ncbi:MAG TPA: hypothetical protein VII06_16340 [Chloroflexota bacterium]|jgi:hypothetical protein
MWRFVLAGVLASGVALGSVAPTFAQDGLPPTTFNQAYVPPEFMMGGPAQPAYGTPEVAPQSSGQTAGAEWMRAGMPGETGYIPGNQFVSGGRGGRSGCAVWDWNAC